MQSKLRDVKIYDCIKTIKNSGRPTAIYQRMSGHKNIAKEITVLSNGMTIVTTTIRYIEQVVAKI